MNSATRTSGSQNVKECYRGEHSFSWSRSGHEKKEINEEKQKKVMQFSIVRVSCF